MKIHVRAGVFPDAIDKEGGWIVSTGEVYGHGATVADAIQALKAKFSSGGDDVTITVINDHAA